MRLLLLIISFFLFHGEVYAALPAPPTPPAISEYVKAVFKKVKDNLNGAPAAIPLSCTSELGAQRRAEAAENLRETFFDVDAAVTQPEHDLERTACYKHDAEALEQYLRALIDLMLKSTYDPPNCYPEAQAAYQQQVQEVWRFLYALRRFGLDPTIQVPVTATGIVALPSPLPLPTADDALCPYHSAYASPVFGNLGCQLSPSTASPRLSRETDLFGQILQHLNVGGGIAQRLVDLRKTLSGLWVDVTAFVKGVSVVRPPGPLTNTGAFDTGIALVPNAGESGCLGWPSDVGGVGAIVTAEGVPLQNYYPLVLTRDLAEVVQYLRLRERPSFLEYVESLRRERESSNSEQLPPSSYDERLQSVNQEHVGLETFSILTIRDPQRKIASLADALHTQTRAFAAFASPVSALAWPPPDTPLPPLRAFAKAYATFLSRMCVNRGCSANLLRSVELSLRPECFSSFLMNLFFEANPTASTLPACRILYVP